MAIDWLLDFQCSCFQLAMMTPLDITQEISMSSYVIELCFLCDPPAATPPSSPLPLPLLPPIWRLNYCIYFCSCVSRWLLVTNELWGNLRHPMMQLSPPLPIPLLSRGGRRPRRPRRPIHSHRHFPLHWSENPFKPVRNLQESLNVTKKNCKNISNW